MSSSQRFAVEFPPSRIPVTNEELSARARIELLQVAFPDLVGTYDNDLAERTTDLVTQRLEQQLRIGLSSKSWLIHREVRAAWRRSRGSQEVARSHGLLGMQW